MAAMALSPVDQSNPFGFDLNATVAGDIGLAKASIADSLVGLSSDNSGSFLSFTSPTQNSIDTIGGVLSTDQTRNFEYMSTSVSSAGDINDDFSRSFENMGGSSGIGANLGYGEVMYEPNTISYTTDISALQAELDTPEKTLGYMGAYFSYYFHYGYTPYTPEELNANGVGDCKDFATFFSWSLQDDGWETATISMNYNNEGGGHVVNIYQGSEGNYYVQSNQGYIGPISSVEDGLQQTVAGFPEGSYVGAYQEFPAGWTGSYQI